MQQVLVKKQCPPNKLHGIIHQINYQTNAVAKEKTNKAKTIRSVLFWHISERVVVIPS
jgi:hypothetical protein